MSKIKEFIKKEFKVIGRHRYNSLKYAVQYLEEHKKNGEDEIDLYLKFRETYKISFSKAIEEINKFDQKWNSKKNLSEEAIKYLKNIGVNKYINKKQITKDWLFKEFDKEYFRQNNVRYSRTKESLENIKPLIYYFIGDIENFKKCINVSSLSKQSFNKGLLIIGGYGNGKTSVMKTIENVLKKTNITFKGYPANDVITMYEACQNANEKDVFYKKMNNGTRYFDDILTERIASNYGKNNLFKDIFEIRYEKKMRTYVTCNYKDNTSDDLKAGLHQFGEKYGSRVYDRLFSMFNIIEFKGRSFRK